MTVPQPVRVLYNPGARGERAPDLREQLGDARAGAEIRELPTLSEVEREARSAAEAGVPVVVAAGGDGTVNAAANGLVGSRTALGILPIGTVNVFAQELGIPLKVHRAWSWVGEGTPRSIDLGRIRFSDGAKRVFVQLAGAGLDAKIVGETSLDSKRRLGPLSYLLTGVRILTESAQMVQVRTAHGDEVQGSVILIGNGSRYAGPFTVFPDARNDDGWLDACVFTSRNALDIVRNVQGVILGLLPSMADVVSLRSKRFELSGAAAPVEADGDLVGSTPATIDILPGALRVIAPPRNRNP